MAKKTILIVSVFVCSVFCDIEYNEVNDDGSFAFRHSNSDIGSYYHSAAGSPDRIVRGRYGSRNPSNGQVEEVVYTAGPRGFRANGPQIHRKMDLSQYPRGPTGSIDDPLADPYDDPSYSFKFRTPEHERSEDADSTGRIRGLYSFLDDEGERHTVRYAAGAGTGFEVLNAVPDAAAREAYNAPLYKAPSWTRGKMAVERGPDGQYKFIASGPDHRRSETVGPDGVVRGSYSYLDDKGVQRTVEYIAGAGIGYKVVQNTVGTGTHLNPRPAYLDFGTSSRREFLESSGSGRIRSKDDDKEYESSRDEEERRGTSGLRNRAGNGSLDKPDANKKGGFISNSIVNGSRDRSRYGGESGSNNREENDSGNRGQGGFNDRSSSRGSNNSRGYDNDQKGSNNSRGDSSRQRGSSSARGENSKKYGSSSSRGESDYSHGKEESSGYRSDNRSGSNRDRGYDYNPRKDSSDHTRSGSSRNRDDDSDNIPPTVTNNRRVLEIERERDWSQRSRDSSIIKNVGKWYIGLPPGQAVRAHVQNIDLSPLGGRIPSPSEALRMDEIHDRHF